MSNLEIIGFIFGIAGVWLTVKKHISCFPVGIVNVVITGWLVWNQRLYADFLQQVVYLVLLVYGWYAWIYGKNNAIKDITHSSLPLKAKLIAIFIVVSGLMGFILWRFTDAAYPYLDSTGTTICFIAQWLIAVKKIENWHLWIVANLMYIGIYYLKDMPLYSLLSGVYLVMAIIGLLEWKKMMLRQQV